MLLESLEYKVQSMEYEKRVLYVVGRTGLEPSSLVFVESGDAFRKFRI